MRGRLNGGEARYHHENDTSVGAVLNIPLGHSRTIMPVTQTDGEAFNSNEVRETNGFCAFARPWHGLKKWLYYNLFFFSQKSMTYQMGISVVLRHISSKSMNSSDKGLLGRLSDHRKPKITPNETFAATLTTPAHAGTLSTFSARHPVLSENECSSTEICTHH